jgi:hypothetical protein
VSLFLNLDNYITRFNAGELIGLSMEDITLSIRCTLVDLDIKDLLLFENFFAIACLAFVFLINNFTCSIALIARLCALTVHTWS